MEFDDILKELYKKEKKVSFEETTSENIDLKRKLQLLKEASLKVLEDFEKLQTQYRDLKKEKEDLNNTRKELYKEVTSLRKKETAYTKAIGAIYGALEVLKKEIDA